MSNGCRGEKEYHGISKHSQENTKLSGGGSLVDKPKNKLLTMIVDEEQPHKQKANMKISDVARQQNKAYEEKPPEGFETTVLPLKVNGYKKSRRLPRGLKFRGK